MHRDCSPGKIVQSDDLRKIEDIVNDQIKAELAVYAKEATLTEAKSIKGLRAVFGEVGGNLLVCVHAL